jgi:hypothetical protein
MKPSIFVLVILMIYSPQIRAAETWELCLDKGDFTLNADTFLKSHRVSKSGCDMRFIELGGKGTKFQINVCDPNIRIDQFAAIDSESYNRFYAGSTGCPAPLFGADFGVTQKGAVEFDAAKKRVNDIFQALKRVYAPKSTSADAEKIHTAKEINSEIQLACSQLFIEEYLDKCNSFEAKPKEVKIQPVSDLRGVHPQTIKK